MSKEQSAKRVVLATGESANTHAVNSTIPILFENMDNQIVKFTVVSNGAILTHEEHGPMVFDKGTYYKTNQVEFNPFNNTISYVFD